MFAVMPYLPMFLSSKISHPTTVTEPVWYEICLGVLGLFLVSIFIWAIIDVFSENKKNRRK